MRDFVCAVDVGTGSARAGILDRSGALLARAEHPIRMNRPLPDHAEHDSEDIWSAVCHAVRQARRGSGVPADRVAAIAFDATCSLVVRGQGGRRLGVSAAGGGGVYVIVTGDMLSRVPAGRVSTSGGLTAAAQSLSHIVVNPLMGKVIDRTHSYAGVLVTLGLVVVPTSLVFALWPMRTRDPGMR